MPCFRNSPRSSARVTAMPSPGMRSGMPICSMRANSSCATSSMSSRLPSTSICLERLAMNQNAWIDSCRPVSSSNVRASSGCALAMAAAIIGSSAA